MNDYDESEVPCRVPWIVYAALALHVLAWWVIL